MSIKYNTSAEEDANKAMRHRGLRLQLLFIFTSNYYIRSIKKQCSYFFQYNNLEKKKKIWIKKTNLSSNLEPVSLDFLIAKGMAMVAMKIFWFPIKLELRLSKSESNFSSKLIPVGLDFSRLGHNHGRYAKN